MRTVCVYTHAYAYGNPPEIVQVLEVPVHARFTHAGEGSVVPKLGEFFLKLRDSSKNIQRTVFVYNQRIFASYKMTISKSENSFIFMWEISQKYLFIFNIHQIIIIIVKSVGPVFVTNSKYSSVLRTAIHVQGYAFCDFGFACIHTCTVVCMHTADTRPLWFLILLQFLICAK